MKTTVAIVGSGPAGLSTALHLVQMDPSWAQRLVVVDAARHPREKLCGGGLTHYGERILQRLGLQPPEPHVRVNEAVIRHRRQSFTLRADPVFRVFQRSLFDAWLAAEAAKRGIAVLEEEPVERIECHSGHVRIVTPGMRIEATAVVAADGATSTVRRLLRWPDPSRLARLLEVQTPADETLRLSEGAARAVFDFDGMSEGLQGYYWDFPMTVDGVGAANRGVFDSRAVARSPRPSPRRILEAQLARRQIRIGDLALKGHPIRWYHPDGSLSRPRVLLVGDAAGVDPLFGEGISFALGYGRPAARTLDRASRTGDFGFSGYRKQIFEERIFRHLRKRTLLARIAYAPRPAWATDCLWAATRLAVRLSPWAGGDHRPLEHGKMDRY